MVKKLIFCACVLYIQSFSMAALQAEFDPQRLRSYVRLMLNENADASGYSDYRGVSLGVETRDTITNNPVFVAEITFGSAKGKSSLFRCYPSKVRVHFLEGTTYFAQGHPYPPNPLMPYLLPDNTVDLRIVNTDSLSIRRSAPREVGTGGVVHQVYQQWIKTTFCQFQVASPISFSGLRQLLETVKIDDPEHPGARIFPPYALAGFSYYHDGVNCLGFSLRILHQLGLQMPLGAYLRVYLDHHYADGFGGWWRTRFGRGVRTLRLESSFLKKLFTKDAAGIVNGSTIPGMQLVRMNLMGPGAAPPAGGAGAPVVLNPWDVRAPHHIHVLTAYPKIGGRFTAFSALPGSIVIMQSIPYDLFNL